MFVVLVSQPPLLPLTRNHSITVSPLRYHACQYDQVDQEHCADYPKREHRQPALTYAVLLEPCQCVDAQAILWLIEDVVLAFRSDVALWTEELYGGFDQTRYVQYEQDERSYYKDAWKKPSLDDE